MRKDLAAIKIGDTFVRMLAFQIPCDLQVTKLTDTVIEGGLWTFDRATGAEIDEYLNWGPPPLMTGSFIARVKEPGVISFSDYIAGKKNERLAE